MSDTAMATDRAGDARAADALRLPERFGFGVEVALAEIERQRANLFAAAEIAAGCWPVARDLVVTTGPDGSIVSAPA